MPGLDGKVALKATKEKPQSVTVKLDTTKGDVGDIAKAVGACDTPHKEKVPPVALLVLPAKDDLTKESAAKIKDALKDVKGVDAAGTRVHVKSKAIDVKLASDGGAKLADIKKALADYIRE